jgi:tetratricopeptide (TPR) repeat protein
MLGVTHHILGNQAAAQQHCENGLKLSAARTRGYVDAFGYDHYVRALIILARAQWISGRPECALRFAHQAIDEADTRDRPITICVSLIYTVPVFLWTGEIEEAQEYIDRLIACADKYSLGPFHALGLALKGEALIAQGEVGAGVQILRSALAQLQSDQHNILIRSSRRALAEGLARCESHADARAEIDQALALAHHDDGKFDISDLLRARADILSAEPQPDLASIEASLIGSLEWARKQSALGWQLRAATQLARLWKRQGHAERAQDVLVSTYQQFTEGFETADLKTAGCLLAELGPKSHVACSRAKI